MSTNARNVLVVARGEVATEASNSETEFLTTLDKGSEGFFTGHTIQFTTGLLKGQTRGIYQHHIGSHYGPPRASDTIVLYNEYSLASIPAVGDKFVVLSIMTGYYLVGDVIGALREDIMESIGQTWHDNSSVSLPAASSTPFPLFTVYPDDAFLESVRVHLDLNNITTDFELELLTYDIHEDDFVTTVLYPSIALPYYLDIDLGIIGRGAQIRITRLEEAEGAELVYMQWCGRGDIDGDVIVGENN